ncbi:hypothetical protein [Xanthomonas oryzae]|uniref:Uncharacterized protein n=1 Tax=Xanthomonas oryzae pv. leersiae TaxID=3112258 RepID=A0AAJ6GSM2_9XANT|nr:hypothetical protein [Xanthomonas oryzae]WIX07043.1 hypothetical protein QN060_02440 [Xanthomonas oryzae pv. oryzae]
MEIESKPSAPLDMPGLHFPNVETTALFFWTSARSFKHSSSSGSWQSFAAVIGKPKTAPPVIELTALAMPTAAIATVAAA